MTALISRPLKAIALVLAAVIPLLWMNVSTAHATSANQVPNWDFQEGNTGFQSDYTYCPGPNTGCGSRWGMPEGKYGVDSDPTNLHSGFSGSDHTTGTGKFMVVNGATSTTQAVWQTNGTGTGIPVEAGTEYRFEAWIMSLVPVPQYAPPELRFEVGYAADGGATEPTDWSTLSVPSGYGSAQWTNAHADWTPPQNGRVWLRLMNNATQYLGNDFGLDDIWFSPTTQSPSADNDGDQVPNGEDAFPNDPDETTDTDGDGVGDNADAYPQDPSRSGNSPDTDGDGTPDDQDAFPNDPDETTDTDGDGVGDNADAFPNDPDETTDTDRDGVGDNADRDRDGDGVANTRDAFPMDPKETKDADNDGIGDNADRDRDGDGVANSRDAFPDDPTRSALPTEPEAPAQTVLQVTAKSPTKRLKVGQATTVVAGMTATSSRRLSAHCTVEGVRSKRACRIVVRQAAGTVSVVPACSRGVSVHVRLWAKDGDLRAARWQRTWKVARTPDTVCTQSANG